MEKTTTSASKATDTPLATKDTGKVTTPRELLDNLKARKQNKEDNESGQGDSDQSKNKTGAKFRIAPDVSFLDKDGQKAFRNMHRHHNVIMDGLSKSIDPSLLESNFKALAEHTEVAMDKMTEYLDSNEYNKEKVGKANDALKKSKNIQDDLKEYPPTIGSVLAQLLTFVVNKISGAVNKGDDITNKQSNRDTASTNSASSGLKPPKPRGM